MSDLPPVAVPGPASEPICHCGRVVEPRDPDPWEGRMDAYCYDCASNRCDCYPDECPVKHPAPGPASVSPADAALRSLAVLLEAVDRGRALLPNGALLLEVDAEVNDGMLWRSDASMLLDQDDLAALRSLLAVNDTGVRAMDTNNPVVSPADTLRLRLATINRALYSTEVGVTREREAIAAAAALAEWEAERAALLAVGERDRRQIARLTERLTDAQQILARLEFLRYGSRTRLDELPDEVFECPVCGWPQGGHRGPGKIKGNAENTHEEGCSLYAVLHGEPAPRLLGCNDRPARAVLAGEDADNG